MRSLQKLPKSYATITRTPHSIASSFRPSLLTLGTSRIYPSSKTPHLLRINRPIRHFSSTFPSKMSYSNTTVPGDKPADPYTATNKSDPELKEKVQDLVSFVESCKFGMMTTRIESSGLLTSRCMALAAKVWFQAPIVCPPPELDANHHCPVGRGRSRPSLPYQHRIRQN